MNENKNATPLAPDTDADTITPKHLSSVLLALKEIVKNEGGGEIQINTTVGYQMQVLEYALAQTKRADDAEAELDRQADYARLTVNHNGGGANG